MTGPGLLPRAMLESKSAELQVAVAGRLEWQVWQSARNSHMVIVLGVGGNLVPEKTGPVESCSLQIVLQILEVQTGLAGSSHFQTDSVVEHYPDHGSWADHRRYQNLALLAMTEGQWLAGNY